MQIASIHSLLFTLPTVCAHCARAHTREHIHSTQRTHSSPHDGHIVWTRSLHIRRSHKPKQSVKWNYTRHSNSNSFEIQNWIHENVYYFSRIWLLAFTIHMCVRLFWWNGKSISECATQVSWKMASNELKWKLLCNLTMNLFRLVFFSFVSPTRILSWQHRTRALASSEISLIASYSPCITNLHYPNTNWLTQLASSAIELRTYSYNSNGKMKIKFKLTTCGCRTQSRAVETKEQRYRKFGAKWNYPKKDFYFDCAAWKRSHCSWIRYMRDVYTVSSADICFGKAHFNWNDTRRKGESGREKEMDKMTV